MTSIYERLVERYESGLVPWDHELPPPEVIAVLQSLPPGHALDLGCGYGRASIYMAQQGWQVDGVDFVAQAVAEAERRADAAGVAASATFHLHAVTSLPFLSGPYDFALDVGCLHNFDEVMNRFSFLWGIIAVLLLAACTQGENTAVSAAPTTVLPGIIRETVTVTAANGLQLQAAFSAPGGAELVPGVILLHMLGSDRMAWEEVGAVDALLQEGYAVLAVDMRGHGETGSHSDWALAQADLRPIWDYLVSRPEVDKARTAVIGASIGANLALIAGAKSPAIKAVILLSPGLDYRGVTTDDALAAYGARPLLIVASAEDSYAANSARTLHEQAEVTATLQIYQGAGHGTDMFAGQSDLLPLLLDWLHQHL